MKERVGTEKFVEVLDRSPEVVDIAHPRRQQAHMDNVKVL